MDELTFLLILAGIAVVLLVAMFTYYKHHKKIHDEIQDFNHHSHAMDDVLLDEHNAKKTGPVSYSRQDPLFSGESLQDSELPDSFSASKRDHLDVDDIKFHQGANQKNDTLDKGELVDGVYINSKRVISNGYVTEQHQSDQVNNTTDTFKAYISSTSEPPNPDEDGTAGDAHTEVVKNETVSELQEQVQEQEQEQVPTFTESEKPKSPEPVSAQQTIKVVYDSVPEGVNELIISHTILNKGDFFTGEKLFNVVQKAGLAFGEMNIFHYPGDDSPETFALFSIANIVEPGTFNPAQVNDFSTPGISMFMRLPTRTDSNEAYDKFIEVAQRIASELGGELCDETRSQLTQQTISYKKEQIKALNFNLAKAKKLAGMK